MNTDSINQIVSFYLNEVSVPEETVTGRVLTIDPKASWQTFSDGASAHSVAKDYRRSDAGTNDWLQTISTHFEAHPHHAEVSGLNVGNSLAVKLDQQIGSSAPYKFLDRLIDHTTDKGSRPIVLRIENAGFEKPVLEDFTFTTTTPVGWQLYNPNGLIPAQTTDDSSSPGTFNPATQNYPGGVPEGNNVGNLFLVNEIGSGEAGISQTLHAKLAANTRYTLSVEVGNPGGNDPVPGITFDGFPGYRVELLADGKVLAADNNSVQIADGTFGTSTVTYTSSATDPLLGKQLGIRLINILQGPGIEVDFDKVQLTAQAVSCGSTRSHRCDRGLGELSASLHKVAQPELPAASGGAHLFR